MANNVYSHQWLEENWGKFVKGEYDHSQRMMINELSRNRYPFTSVDAVYTRPEFPPHQPAERIPGMNVNKTTAIFLVAPDAVRAIAVDYENVGGKDPQRVICKTLDKTIVAGDYVVVQTESRHKMTVVKVVECDVELDVNTSEKIMWIWGRVDVKEQEQVLRQEQMMLDKIKNAQIRKQRRELRDALLTPDALDDLAGLTIGGHTVAIAAPKNEEK